MPRPGSGLARAADPILTWGDSDRGSGLKQFTLFLISHIVQPSPDRSEAKGVIGSGERPTSKRFRAGLGQIAVALFPGSDQIMRLQ